MVEAKCRHADGANGFGDGERDDGLGDGDWWVMLVAIVSGFSALWTRCEISVGGLDGM
jgi:hypothetical protein